MADFIVLGIIAAVIIMIIVYLVKQKQACHTDACGGCSEYKKSCDHCDVETLKKELKAELHK
ncbi:MAG: hypothetical protein FD133_879 [Erysipelotrichaceae bacterium]|nr:MAG: hypothetical protein FD179_771 [Erysipelotrichaceae bacterium]TXT18383.1 MAG: hypothetical protein FD133_879 [Erysipelotrichaceae bacterium]